MRALLSAALLTVVLTPSALAFPHACVGSKDCRVCRNCRYCKHCAQLGGTCGVKERLRRGEKPPAAKSARSKHKKAKTH